MVEDYEKYVEFFRSHPDFQRQNLETTFEKESRFAARGRKFYSLQQTKDFWFLMSVALPEPVHRTEFPELFGVDWHFDDFDDGFRENQKSVPKDTRAYIQKASAKARELFKKGEIDAAGDLMAAVWHASWTRKGGAKKLAEILDD